MPAQRYPYRIPYDTLFHIAFPPSTSIQASHPHRIPPSHHFHTARRTQEKPTVWNHVHHPPPARTPSGPHSFRCSFPHRSENARKADGVESRTPPTPRENVLWTEFLPMLLSTPPGERRKSRRCGITYTTHHLRERLLDRIDSDAPFHTAQNLPDNGRCCSACTADPQR